MMCKFDTDHVKQFGLTPAIVLGQMIEQYNDALEKNLVLESTWFRLNNRTILSRTGLITSYQDSIIKSFIKAGVISKRTYNREVYYQINDLTKKYDGFVLETKEDTQNKKRLYFINKLKNCVQTTNEELSKAYFEWIEEVYNKKNYLSVKAVSEAQSVIDEYANHDLDVALELLNIATVSTYADMHWAIIAYERFHKIYKNSPHSYLDSAKTTIYHSNDGRKLDDEIF